MSSIYIHIPFCERKCFYCDFYSIENHEPIDNFLTALHNEIELNSSYGKMESVQTIYFGGGTPSLLTSKQIYEIIERIRDQYSIMINPEITIEVNPGTIDRDKLEGYSSAGVNRLSIGVQSFNDAELKFLTRIHNSNDAELVIELAKKSGFKNISIDLIYSLPDQSITSWNETLTKAVSFEPEHISAYSLIVENNTPLASKVSTKEIIPLSNEKDAEMYELTMSIMEKSGYEHYEISNYAKPGFHSKHNSNYWNHSNYISFGPSAHSYWGGRRWWNIRNIDRYIERLSENELPVEGEEYLMTKQLLDETIMLELRTGALNLSGIQSKFGVDIKSQSKSILEQLLTDGLARFDRNVIRLTNKGFLVCDEIIEKLMNETG